MNAPIVRLFALVIVLFALLVAFTSRWSVFEANALRDNPNNRRLLFEEQRIKRGIIRAADGTVLAANRTLSQDRYERRYPTGELFAQPVGFTSLDRGRIGLEHYYNDALTGRRKRRDRRARAAARPSGRRRRPAHDARPEGPGGRLPGPRRPPGAVVAIDIKTGAVRVLAATPSYDPNDPKTAKTFNRATQGRFPPGSTMKTVTATAALDSGKYTPDSTVSGKNDQVISGTPLQNFGGEDFGDITLSDALTNSVNTVWAKVAEDLGRKTMAEYMKQFGFYEDPPMDYPDDQMLPERRGRPHRPAAVADVGADRRRAHGRSGRTSCSSRRCRWRRSRRRSPTAACGWSRDWSRRSSIPTAARSTSRCPRRRSA